MIDTARRFIIHTQAWWATANPMPTGVVERITVCDDDSEFLIQFYVLGGNPACRLCVFDDAWKLLAQLEHEFGFVTQILAEKVGSSPSPEGWAITLANMGFVDATPRTYGKDA